MSEGRGQRTEGRGQRAEGRGLSLTDFFQRQQLGSAYGDTNSSALRETVKSLSCPPATRTVPSGSNVAVC